MCFSAVTLKCCRFYPRVNGTRSCSISTRRQHHHLIRISTRRLKAHTYACALLHTNCTDANSTHTVLARDYATERGAHCCSHSNTHTARIDMQTSPVYSPTTDAQQRSIVLPRRDTCHAAHSARRQTRVRLRQHTPRALRTRTQLCSLRTAHPATPIAASHAPHQFSSNHVNRLARRALCTAHDSQLSSAHCARGFDSPTVAHTSRRPLLQSTRKQRQ